MAEGLCTPSKGRNQDVELLFQKMGEKLGWFQHKDIDTALKSITKSSKKKGSRSRVRSGDGGNKENRGDKGVANKHGDAKNESTKERTKRTKKKACKAGTENSASQESCGGYPLKASKARTDLTREIKKKKKSSKASQSPPECSESKNESNPRLSGGNSENSDVFPEMPSLLEDIGAPLVESTRIHSRESLSLYKLQDSFMSSESCDSSAVHDQSSFNKLEGGLSDGARYFRTDKTLIRIRNSLTANELKKKQLDSSSENYYSVIGESIAEEDKDEYYSVLEESPVGCESVKCKSEHGDKAVTIKESGDEEESKGLLQTQKRMELEDEEESRGLLQTQKRLELCLEPVQGDMGVEPLHGHTGMEPVHGDAGMEPVLQRCHGNSGMRYREVCEPGVGSDESDGSYYEVEDACAQTDLDDRQLDAVGHGVKVIASGSSDEGGNSESDLEDGDAATVIENKLGVTDLCDRLMGLQHESNDDDDDEDDDDDDDDDGGSGGGSSIKRVSEGSEKEDDITGESSPSDSEGKVLTRKHVRHIQDSPGESEGSFYEVVDQCVQTDVNVSQTEDAADVVTPCTQKGAGADGACTSPYFPPSNQVKSQPSLLKNSNSGTPTLAELKSATYEKLRMSVKRFNNTPQGSSGRLMDNVLKKINLFGSNAGHSSFKVSSGKDGKKVEGQENVKPSTDKLDEKLSKNDRTEVKNADDDSRDAKTAEDVVQARKSCTDRHFSDIIMSGQEDSTSSGRDVRKSSSSESFHETHQVSDAENKAVKPAHKDRKAVENIVENLQKMSFGSKVGCKEDNSVRGMPIETPSRRLKLSLRKNRPVKKVSSASSGSTDEHPGRKELYKTGYSSPDYSAESPKGLDDHTGLTSKCGTSKEKCKPTFTVPDSPPQGSALSEQANEDELVSDGETGVPDSQPPLNENRLVLQANEENLFSDEEEAAVPDSPTPEKKDRPTHEKIPHSDERVAGVSDSSSDEFHSIHVPETSKIPTSSRSGTDRKTHPKEKYTVSDSSSEDYENMVKKAKEKKGKRVMEKKSVSRSRNDSLPDRDASPDLDDRYCVTVGNATTWRDSTAAGDSSEEEDVEAFFKKMKSQKKTQKPKLSSESSDSDSMKEFIDDDSIVSSDSEDDVFYLKVDNSKKDKQPPRIPEYLTSDEENDATDEDGDRTYDESSEEEEYQPKTSRKHMTKETTKTPKIVHRKYETPKAQIVSRIPSSAKSSVTSSASRVKICSFLQSLTADLPDHRRHPDASTYVKQFKKYKMELTQRLYKLYNQTVFDQKLPSSLEIGWNNRLLKTAGYCKYIRGHTAKVELSDKVCDSAERVRDTLIHELCHAASWTLNHKNDGHGPYWKYWARKANQTYPDIPIISRCHDYAIATKYTYQCVKCGYSIGRHSKSLDTDRKVCGKCHGRFEVRLSKNSATSSISSTPKTPRTPNRFALFVKEKYGTYKKNKDLKHKDIMQLLSQEFAAKNKLTA
ncbi:dentin sialophosphoprotein-like [Haliotis rufescens]|uniref:dentin sialophosphoprotein-like n=1 Tax=Haliotis rufescens TaxID=6454 RepID=UPI00201F22D7|nr:dentin sialophosphoprotein-like [Haliotis rufescens]XP_046329102.2 dentin sialophosphoprotein-like [Haliotis rufescens]